MKDIVIVGATGFVGRYLAADILQQNEARLRVLIHKSGPDIFPRDGNVTFIDGDLLLPETLDKLCVEGAVVVNMAYLRGRSRQDNLTAVNNLLEACRKAGIGRFIHLSSISVFGRVSDDIVTEDTNCDPIDEYEITKMEIEKAVLEKASGVFEAVILRPTAIFGPGGKNLLKLANDLRLGNKAVNYLKACLSSTRKMNLVSVHNVAAAIGLFMRTDKKIDREVFIISDDEFKENSYSFIEKYLMRSLGIKDYPFPVLPIPDLALKVLLKLSSRSNCNPTRKYDCQKLLNFGFRKSLSFQDELADFADWYNGFYKLQKSAL